MPREQIIDAARQARSIWRISSGVSEQTRAAQAVTRSWQDSVRAPGVETEARVSADSNEAIDVLELPVAFEMKVSANNPHHEFFKDVFKIIAYNRNHASRIEELVFLTDPGAAVRLQRGLGRVAAETARTLGFEVTVVAL
jgi:ketosteroid isomerase-like protein